MGKKEEQPPSLFDNLDMFAAGTVGGVVPNAPQPKKNEASLSGGSGGLGTSRPTKKSEKRKTDEATKPFAEASKKGLTGTGPMQELYDFNFRQYSAYVICDRAIPAVEDGLKPVQRRIMHSLWEKDDGRYTKVANIVGHAMQ